MAKSVVRKQTSGQADNAVVQLQEQIEAIRKQAYQEGYSAAMRAVTDFAAGPTKPKTTTTPPKPQRGRIPSKATAKPATRRKFNRGDNARHVAEAMATLPDRTGPAGAIRKALAAKGINLAYTSIRHALGQLQARGEASVASDGKTWSYTAQAA